MLKRGSFDRVPTSPTMSLPFTTAFSNKKYSGSSNLEADDDAAMKNPLSKINDDPRQRKYAIAGVGLLVLAALFFLSGSGSSSGALGGTTSLRFDKFPETFRIAVIADLDQRSKKENGKQWYSTYMTGTLRRNDATYSLKWDAPVDLVTGHNEAGRGCELSELVRFNDDLYTFDDRTGIMFQIANPDRSDASPAPLLLPRHIFSEGGGSINDKGLKIEWATVKDGLLYTGSFGKEFTNMEGKVVHTNNLWAVSYGKDGTVTHLDWKPYYDKLRSAMGYEYPGYLLHECITWSPHHRKWFILPRRMSKVAYEEALDEKMGANTMIIASHDFEDITWFSVGTKTDVRGFSSAKFLPGSRDSVLVALKSEENSASGTQKTYITIYGEVPAGSGKWDVLMEETELPIAAKFEGLEVLSAS